MVNAVYCIFKAAPLVAIGAVTYDCSWVEQRAEVSLYVVV